jgi:hypothetical protein
MKIHVYHHFCDEENKKLDKLIQGQEEIKTLIIQSVADPVKLQELAKKLDEGQKNLQEAIDKNKIS